MYLLLQLLSAVSSILFLVLLPFRLSKLCADTSKVVPKHAGRAKVVSVVLLAPIELLVADPLMRFLPVYCLSFNLSLLS